MPRFASPLLVASLVASGGVGCFALFPLEELGEGSPDTATIDAGREASTSDGSAEGGAEDGRLVFVTDATFDGDLGRVQGADARCTQAANAAGRAGSFKAIVSEGSAPASTRIAAQSADGRTQIVDVRGRLVATSLATLFASGPLIAIDRTETDHAIPAPTSSACTPDDTGTLGFAAWTATDAKGAHTSGAGCDGFESSSPGSEGVVGFPAVRAQWLSGCETTCLLKAHLYCLQE